MRFAAMLTVGACMALLLAACGDSDGGGDGGGEGVTVPLAFDDHCEDDSDDVGCSDESAAPPGTTFTDDEWELRYVGSHVEPYVASEDEVGFGPVAESSLIVAIEYTNGGDEPVSVDFDPTGETADEIPRRYDVWVNDASQGSIGSMDECGLESSEETIDPGETVEVEHCFLGVDDPESLASRSDDLSGHIDPALVGTVTGAEFSLDDLEVEESAAAEAIDEPEDCGEGVTVTGTDCSFALEVAQEYSVSAGPGLLNDITVENPAGGGTETLSCTRSGPEVFCRGDDGIEVVIAE
jgi:hypothetical protein